jgi:hypothetical protein
MAQDIYSKSAQFALNVYGRFDDTNRNVNFKIDLWKFAMGLRNVSHAYLVVVAWHDLSKKVDYWHRMFFTGPKWQSEEYKAGGLLKTMKKRWMIPPHAELFSTAHNRLLKLPKNVQNPRSHDLPVLFPRMMGIAQ